MIKVNVNGKREFTVEGSSINGENKKLDLVELGGGNFHMLREHKGYNATLKEFNAAEKTMLLNINGNDYEIGIRDHVDMLMEQLGMRSNSNTAVQSLKAPMPGLIINISVKTGDEIRKGDTLIVLEAMKMENVIKSPRNGKIKKINVQLRLPVEKNQVMLEFE